MRGAPSELTEARGAPGALPCVTAHKLVFSARIAIVTLIQAWVQPVSMLHAPHPTSESLAQNSHLS